MTSNPMAYRVRAYWNGAQVLEASASAVMASDIACGYMRDTFAGSFARAEIERQLAHILDRVLDGQSVQVHFKDSTGSAIISIWRPLETAKQVQPSA